jgi:hypothetical protein
VASAVAVSPRARMARGLLKMTMTGLLLLNAPRATRCNEIVDHSL